MKKEKNNYIQKTMKELNSILDPDYFHVSITLKGINQIEWEIYYKNLPDNAYFSKKNKPLLTSKENSLRDIHLLNERFEKEKEKEFTKNLPELIDIICATNDSIWKTKGDFVTFALSVQIGILLLILVNAVYIHSTILSISLLAATCIATLITRYFQDKIYNDRDQMYNNMKKQWIKGKIRRLGFYFVEKIKLVRKD